MDGQVRAGKVRGSVLPQEVKMSRFVGNISGGRSVIYESSYFKDTWTTATPACNWRHVHCDMEGNVKELHWGNLRLSGSLSWSDLPSTVTVLELSFNFPYPTQLTGQIDTASLPNSLEKFIAATSRFVGSIDFSHLPPKLGFFAVGRNLLSGPVDLTELPRGIELISLCHNNFSGVVDVSRLPPKLKMVELYGNQLQLLQETAPECVYMEDPL